MSREIALRGLPWDDYHDAEWHAAYRQAVRELDAEFPDPPIMSPQPELVSYPISTSVLGGAIKGIGKIGKVAALVVRGAAPGVISLGDWHR